MKTLLGLAAVAALALAASANAATIYDNINAATTSNDDIDSFGPLADSFSTTGATTLSSVELKIFYGPIDPADQITVDLLADNSTSPDALIANIGTIDDSTLTLNQDNYVTLTTDQPLSADTRYWIELSSSDLSAFWDWSSDTSGPGVSGEYYYFNGSVFPNTDGPYQMDLIGTVAGAVPEPASWALMLLGFGGLGWALRSRRGAPVAV